MPSLNSSPELMILSTLLSKNSPNPLILKKSGKVDVAETLKAHFATHPHYYVVAGVGAAAVYLFVMDFKNKSASEPLKGWDPIFGWGDDLVRNSEGLLKKLLSPVSPL